MAISFVCGSCTKLFTVGLEMAGKTGRCKRCGQFMFIPFQSTSRPVRTWAPDPGDAVATPPRPRSRGTLEAIEDDSPPPTQLVRTPPPVSVGPAPVHAKPKQRKKSGWGTGGSFASRFRINVWSVGGLVVLAVFLLRTANVITGGAISGGLTRAMVSRTTAQYDDKPIALPRLPDLGPGRQIEPGVTFHEIRLGLDKRPLGASPGQGGKLWLYLPSDANGADHSVPCLLTAGAGTPLIHGIRLDENDRMTHLPLVRAGFAVLAFELDGPVDSAAGQVSDHEATEAAIRFLTARAGLVNAHIALEYALRKVPAVDPARISILGHSSAGTLAVLFAETEPRLHSAVAFAPALDVAKRFGPEHSTRIKKGGMDAFLTRYSPINGVANLRCPLFLFQARDDDNTPVGDADDFVAQARSAGKEVTYDVVAQGGHTRAVLGTGFPHPIAWLKGQPVPALGFPPVIFADVPPPADLAPARSPATLSLPERRSPVPVTRPVPDPFPKNAVERERAEFEAAKKRRDALRQKALGRGARPANAEPEGSTSPR